LSRVKSVAKTLKKEIYSQTPPSVFVGRENYPRVFTGPLLLACENTLALKTPKEWYGHSYHEILEACSSLLRVKKKVDVRYPEKIRESVKEIALSEKPVYIEAKFSKLFALPKFSAFFHPIGMSGKLEKIAVASNPKVSQKVEKILEDELKASTQAIMLYEKGYDVYEISRFLSAGCMGIEKRIVPTRWSITAADDVIANYLREKILKFPEISEILVWSNEHLDNHFEILFIPGSWRFEQFEAWFPGSYWSMHRFSITVERESFRGRTSYAEEQGGGYYAARLAICEQLVKMKKQASVVVFREIYKGYVIPVGVWEIRETIRKAFEKSAEKFSSISEALKAISQRLRVPIEEYVKRSSILSQKTLWNF